MSDIHIGLAIVVALMLLGGCFFALTAAVGVVRMPDFFTRLHPAGKGDTGAQMLILGALVLVGIAIGDAGTSVKLVLIVIFLLITAPTATHAITRAAWVSGLRPWQRDAGTDAEVPADGDGEGADADGTGEPDKEGDA